MGRAMKDSGIEWIGEIPDTWSVFPMKSVIISNDGGIWGDDPIGDGSDKVVIRSTEQSIDGKWQIIAPATRNLAGLKVDRYRILPGDLLMTKSSGSDLHIGKTTIAGQYFNENECYYSNFIQRIRINQFAKYYWYILNSTIARDQFVYLQNTTSGIGNINAKDIEKIYVPLPPKDEQYSISRLLDEQCAQVDSIISQTCASIEEYKHLKQAVITQVVTKGVRGDRPMKESGSVWFGDIPSEWNMKRLKYIFHIKKDIAGKEGYTVLSITQQGIKPKDLSKNEGQLAENYSKYQFVVPGDFAMNHMDLLTGWADISTYSGVTSPDYRVFVLNDTKHNCPRYFLYMMQMCYSNRIFYGLGQGVSGMGRWRLQADKFLNFIITIPPLDEQQEIAAYLDETCAKIDALMAKKEQLLTELDAYKKSLIYEYVTGKKTVPEQQEPVAITFVDSRLLLMCRIIELMNPQGRTLLQKGIFCADCLLGLNDETEYVRYPYGPYDIRIEEYEKALVKKGWVIIRKGSSVSYTLGANFEEYRKAYQAKFGTVDADIQKICAFLEPMRSSQAGRVATLLAVWNDFLIDNVSPTDAQIINEARTNWTPNKANTSERTWQGTLDKIRSNGFVPKGYGLHTKFQPQEKRDYQ